MQPHYPNSGRFSPRGAWYAARPSIFRLTLCSALLLAGCRQPPNLTDPEPVRPHAGVQLTVALGQGVDQPHLVRQFAREWSLQSGASVQILPGAWDGQTPADVILLPAVDLPREIVASRIVPLPEVIRSARHPYQWNDLVISIADRLASWDGRAYGLPVFQTGQVLVYRTDLWEQFSAARKLGSPFPETWEELVAFAEFFNRPLQSPSLPAWSRLRDERSDLLHRIAANYDRLSVSETNLTSGPRSPEDRENFFAFDFSTETGEARIQSPAFVHAASLLRRMEACRPAEPADYPLQAFRDGKAVAAFGSLELLSELQAPGLAVRGKYRIAPLPGARELRREAVPQPQENVNRVPYLGEGLWLGAVSTGCKTPDAAWDFLIEMANPTSTALDWISAARWGAGGFRGSQFDSRNRNHWFGYGLDLTQTERLIDIQRQNAAISIANPTLALRLPDRKDYLQSLNAGLTQILQGADPQKTLDGVAQEWNRRKLDPIRYRISLGL